MRPNLWVLKRHWRHAARVRLFCFPFAGGGASAYQDWHEALPAFVDVCPVQLPGRGNRLREPPISHLPSLIEALGTGLMPVLDLPFAFLGHSFGALLGFELARWLRAARAPRPFRLLLSGARAPHLPDRHPKITGLDRPALIAEMRRLGGTPHAVLDDPELMDLVLPAVRADYEAGEAHVLADAAPLDCPFTLLGGREDPLVDEGELRGWERHGRGPCTVRLFAGDHFFLFSNPLALPAIAGDLRDPGSP